MTEPNRKCIGCHQVKPDREFPVHPHPLQAAMGPPLPCIRCCLKYPRFVIEMVTDLRAEAELLERIAKKIEPPEAGELEDGAAELRSTADSWLGELGVVQKGHDVTTTEDEG